VPKVDALVLYEITRRLRLGMRCEVRRRAHDGRPVVRWVGVKDGVAPPLPSTLTGKSATLPWGVVPLVARWS
jgi:hypothetical protein